MFELTTLDVLEDVLLFSIEGASSPGVPAGVSGAASDEEELEELDLELAGSGEWELGVGCPGGDEQLGGWELNSLETIPANKRKQTMISI